MPVGEPDLDLSALPGEGEPLKFTIEIGVRPPAKLGEYKGLEVPRRDAEADDEAINEEIERLRERSAKLETVDRPAGRGDFVVMDFGLASTASRSPAARAATRWSSSAPAGSCPGFEEQLEGAGAGESAPSR